MQRLNDKFFETVEQHLSLSGMKILEVGCGDGKRTVDLAKRCATITGIDPDMDAIERGQQRQIANAIFQVGSAELLSFDDASFDSVFFTLSFHHVSVTDMNDAIAEAVRVLRPSGFIVFYEIGSPGTEDEADGLFTTEGTCDTSIALEAIRANADLSIASDIEYETHFKFDSVDDYKSEMRPTKNLDRIEAFLRKYDYLLSSNRRILIAQTVSENTE